MYMTECVCTFLNTHTKNMYLYVCIIKSPLSGILQAGTLLTRISGWLAGCMGDRGVRKARTTTHQPALAPLCMQPPPPPLSPPTPIATRSVLSAFDKWNFYITGTWHSPIMLDNRDCTIYTYLNYFEYIAVNRVFPITIEIYMLIK